MLNLFIQAILPGQIFTFTALNLLALDPGSQINSLLPSPVIFFALLVSFENINKDIVEYYFIFCSLDSVFLSLDQGFKFFYVA